MFVQTKHRFNVKEYYRMAETGVLPPDARVELLNGEIIDRSPIGSNHAGTVKRFIRIFTKLARDRWMVSAQDPLRLDDHSEPNRTSCCLSHHRMIISAAIPNRTKYSCWLRLPMRRWTMTGRKNSRPTDTQAFLKFGSSICVTNLSKFIASRISPATVAKPLCARATPLRRWPFPMPPWTWRSC